MNKSFNNNREFALFPISTGGTADKILLTWNLVNIKANSNFIKFIIISTDGIEF